MVKTKKNSLVEIFPKQTKLGQGHVGSWINLPYFNMKNTLTPAIRNGKNLSFIDAMAYIRQKCISIKDLQDFIDGKSNDFIYF